MAEASTKMISYHHTPGQRPLEAKTLVQALRESATKRAVNEALVFLSPGKPRRAVTYGQWYDTSMRLASSFIHMGLKTGDRVALLLPNCYEFPMVEFGLLQAGVVPVLLGLTSRSESDFYALLDRFQCKALVLYVDDSRQKQEILKSALKCIHRTGSSETDETSPVLHKIIVVSNKDYEGTENFSDLVKTEINKDNLQEREKESDFESDALIFLTSGSTGLPKGVPFSHMYCVNICQDYFPSPGQREVTITDRPLVHNAPHLFMMFPVITMGWKMGIMPPMAADGGHATVEFLLRALQEEECTFALFVPYQLHDVCRYAETHAVDFGKIRLTLWGGSMMTDTEWRKRLDLFPNLISLYGSTEVIIALQRMGPNSYEERIGNTGYALPNTEVKIADQNGNAMPIGQIGEICIRSYRTAQLRYIGQEIRSSMFEGGWFRMGDLGRMDGKGRLTVLGRCKHSIKRATIMIYPASVERLISPHKMVESVVVVGLPDERLGERVCACVVAKDGSGLTERELERYSDEVFLTEGSSDQLGIRPDSFVILQSLPLIPGSIGKHNLDRIKEIASHALRQK